ncbi:monovalent cation/H+ antiporter subunit A [Staphylococcus gallinarum]|uniref:Monovalent cation/H+ antiporter subunit A n=1 Tax=Staphylococcus gallinarum TaxID=1293 RepID=A0A380FEM2_STAGA|nr:monovalent cation/H+ antiporter subunit A [Staphylococcus gallinarum]
MSLVILFSVLIVLMILLLFTYTHQKLQNVSGTIVMIAPIVSALYFFMANSECICWALCSD